ncbi:sensor histidine kinase [Pseudidiomarina insulisalsae]|uniref:histidine kinase n=1 Tax=Pseudidiomarina insulisalsae TaxID=575789 RepID=A0A432YNL1_9GAMM|nr:HAMP domain-containing sensor histidine kinase [Pseudidiomarina insulisalsae]RUO62536.1 HAMP domain-containing histidine kinase [Pseudidiomarina insulisalsae]
MIRTGSIRQSITWLVISTSVLLSVFAVFIMSMTHLQQVNEASEQRALDIANVIADTSSRYLLFGDAEGLTSYLRYFRSSEVIQHIHIYQQPNLAGDQQLRYFASYNREGTAPIPVRIDGATQNFGVRSTNNYIEAALPVEIENENLGSVYVRLSRETSNEATWMTFVTGSLTILVVALLAWLISLRARLTLLRPLDQAVAIIQRISRNRDYSVRLPESHLLELQQLSISFNTLLGRIEQHLERQQQTERQAQDLNIELERQVKQRTNALRESNEELMETLEKLHQFQRQLIENEKMQSLGDLIAGVAHEINTPVGLVITSTSILQDKLELMQKKFAENTITRNDFERFMEASDDNLGMIQRNIERTADLINQFRQLAMDQFAEEAKQVYLLEFCESVLHSTRERVPQLHDIDVRFECPANLQVTTRVGPLHHVLRQLLENSALHGFAERQGGHITLLAERLDGSHVKLQYRDDGRGIPEDLGRRIFDPFVTSRRRQGSTGLGLHLVYNLVTRALEGSIEVQSRPGRYTEFTMIIKA